MRAIQDEDERYRTKTFVYNDERGMEITVMVTKFTGLGNKALEQAGWRGQYCIFMKVDGGVGCANNDEFTFCNRLAAHNDDGLFTVCHGLKTGAIEWDEIEDGETIYSSHAVMRWGDEI